MEAHTTKKLAKFALSLVAAIILVGTFATPSSAEEPTDMQEKSWPSAEQVVADWWEAPWWFHVNVYGWLPNAPATIKVDGQDVADLPEDFDKILADLELAAMFEVEVHKGPIGFFASPLYYKGKDTEDFRGPAGKERKFTVEEEVWLIKYGASYDLGPWRLWKDSDPPTVILQPYVGGLYLHDDIKLKVTPGAFDIGVDVDTTLKFNTPIIGANTLWNLTKRWGLRLGGNYGGFHVDDVEKTYEGVGTVVYRFKMWDDVSSKVFAGYRYLHLDYKKKEVAIELDVKGPLFGIGWVF